MKNAEAVKRVTLAACCGLGEFTVSPREIGLLLISTRQEYHTILQLLVAVLPGRGAVGAHILGIDEPADSGGRKLWRGHLAGLKFLKENPPDPKALHHVAWLGRTVNVIQICGASTEILAQHIEGDARWPIRLQAV